MISSGTPLTPPCPAVAARPQRNRRRLPLRHPLLVRPDPAAYLAVQAVRAFGFPILPGVREEWFSKASAPAPDRGVTIRLYDHVLSRWVSRWADSRWTPLIWPEEATLETAGDSLWMESTAFSDLTGDHRQSLTIARTGDSWSFEGRREYPGAPPFAWESFEATPLDEHSSHTTGGGGSVTTLLEGFHGSRGLATDDAGNVYMAAAFDSGSDPGTPILRVAPNGDTSVVVPDLLNPAGLAWSRGYLLAKVTRDGRSWLVRIAREGVTTEVAPVPGDALPADAEGNAYTGDAAAGRVRRVSPDGTVTLLAEHPAVVGTLAMAYDDERARLYVGRWQTGEVHAISDDGAVRRVGQFPGLAGSNLAWMAYAEGELFGTGFGAHMVYAMDVETGSVRHVAGRGMPGGMDGPVRSASFLYPNGVAVTSDGSTLYVAELGRPSGTFYPSGRLRRIDLR